MTPPDFARSAYCYVCEDPSIAGSYLCQRCRHLAERGDTRKDIDGHRRRINKKVRVLAMKNQWDALIRAFCCKYTLVQLSDKSTSNKYGTWEHVIPGDESSVVLVADLVNKMKVDMTEREFETMVRALAHKSGPLGSLTSRPLRRELARRKSRHAYRLAVTAVTSSPRLLAVQWRDHPSVQDSTAGGLAVMCRLGIAQLATVVGRQ
jgi:hypothetical protein